MTDPTVELRLAELETRLAHHEHAVDELSAIVAEQGKVIDRMTVAVRALTERLRDVTSDLHQRSPSDDKPPPHY